MTKFECIKIQIAFSLGCTIAHQCNTQTVHVSMAGGKRTRSVYRVSMTVHYGV